MRDCIDIHTHIVPETFPPYAGKGANVPWPSMADAHACHKHVMIQGKVYRTVADGCWSVPRRIEDMGGMRVARQAISPMPELLSYWLPLEDAKRMNRYVNEQIAAMIGRSEEHTSELQSQFHLVCRLLLEKKKTTEKRIPQQTIKRGTRSHRK